MRSLGDDREIVRDQDQRHVRLALNPQQQIEHLRLHGDVERSRRLVGDEESRLTRDRHRDHHALRHPAGQLMWIRVEPRRSVGNLDLLQELERSRTARDTARALAFGSVYRERFHQLMRDRVAGIEARERILEDHCDVLADEIAPFTIADAAQIVARERHPPRADTSREVDQTEQRQRHDALAGTRLADDTDHFALIDR